MLIILMKHSTIVNVFILKILNIKKYSYCDLINWLSSLLAVIGILAGVAVGWSSLSLFVLPLLLLLFGFFLFLAGLGGFGSMESEIEQSLQKSRGGCTFFLFFVKRYLVLYNSCSGRLPVDKCIPLCWQYIKKAVVHNGIGVRDKTILRSIDISTYTYVQYIQA